MKFKSWDGVELNMRVRGFEFYSTNLIDWKAESATPLSVLS